MFNFTFPTQRTLFKTEQLIGDNKTCRSSMCFYIFAVRKHGVQIGSTLLHGRRKIVQPFVNISARGVAIEFVQERNFSKAIPWQ